MNIANLIDISPMTMTTLKNFLLAAALTPVGIFAQDRYATRTGNVSFFSETPLENIDAKNFKATSVYDASTGAVELAVLMKAFEFEKALMQEHFNENYVESDKFPKAVFKGKVTGLPEGALQKYGTYAVQIEGEFTMHGVTKHITMKGSLVVDPTGVLKTSADFTIRPEDYDIKIPGAVRANIAEEIQIKVRVDFQKM